MRRLLLALGTVLALLVVAADPAAATVASTLSLDADAPDPFVLRAGGSYHAYSTEVAGVSVPVRTSASLAGSWSAPRDALPVLPGWARRGRTWAPSVTAFGSTYVLHFTAWHASSDRQCIGVATAPTPIGPFSAVGNKPLVCQLDRGGSIDASVVKAANGPSYLLWKSEENALHLPSNLWSQELSATGTAFAPKSKARVLLTHEPGTWEGYTIEGPTMIRDGSTYHLFYSAGFWSDATAVIGRATCTSPVGPCTKHGPWLTSTDDPKGPSGPEAFRDGDLVRLVHHGWRPETGYADGAPNRRAMYAGTLSFPGGVPALGGA